MFAFYFCQFLLSTIKCDDIDDEFAPSEASFDARQSDPEPMAPIPTEFRPASSSTQQQWSFDHFKLELIFLSGIVFYIALFLSGRSKNRQIASKIISSLEPLLSSQFFFLGPADVAQNLKPTSNNLLYMDSCVRYLSYASGRKNCKGCLVDVSLSPRHDLLSQFMSYLPNIPGMEPVVDEDSATITIVVDEMRDNHSKLVPIICCLSKKSLSKKIFKDNADLSNYACTSESFKELDSAGFTVLSEHVESAGFVFGSKLFQKLFPRASKQIHYIHVSDSSNKVVEGFGPGEDTKFIVKLKFDASKDISDIVPIVLYLLTSVVDNWSNSVISEAALRVIKENRAEVEKLRVKLMNRVANEDAEARKAAERKKKRDDYNLMTDEGKKACDAKDDKARKKQQAGRNPGNIRVKYGKG